MEAIVSSLIGAVSGIAFIFLRDFVFPIISTLRDKRRSEKELYKEYIYPIALALEALMWRLDEILNVPGRGVYLLSSEGSSQYAEYKRISTVYRLAVVIAWFRAFERELLTLRSVDIEDSDKIRIAMREFRNVLADGKSIEIYRLESLLEILNVKEIKLEHKEELALKIDQIVDKYLSKFDINDVSRMPFADLDLLIKSIIGVIKSNEVEEFVPLTEEVRSRIIGIISIRQTWIYRDWQSAIGDSMLSDSRLGNRAYDVIGFGEFEEIWLDNRPRWTTRLSGIFIDFNVLEFSSNDARRMQIKSILNTTASLLASLARDDESIKKAIGKSLDRANSILQETKS